VLALGPLTAAAQTAGGGWPQLQGDAAHTGLRPDAPRPPYAVAWTGRPDAPAGQHLSAPVVSSGVVVVTGPSALYAFHADDGTPAWSVPRDSVPSAPAIAAVDGREAVLSTDGRGPNTATFDAVDLRSGRSIWDAPVRLQGESKSGVTVEGSRAFVADEAGRLYAIDLSSGTISWTARTTGTVAGPVAAGEGLVVAVVAASQAARTAGVVAFDEATGEERWNVSPDPTATVGSLPAFVAGVVVVAFPDGEVFGLSPRDGSQAWRQRIPGAVYPLVSPAVLEGSVVLADSSGGVQLVAPGSGRRWLFQFNEPILRASPVVTRETVVVGFEDGSIGSVSLADGHLSFRSPPAASPVGGIALTDDAVVVSRGGSGRPQVVAFRTDPNGSLLDEASPTQPVAGRLALGFILGIVVGAAIYAPARVLVRRTPIRDPSAASDEQAAEDEDSGGAP
jgi:outer membrane protein assembly factor BamB